MKLASVEVITEINPHPNADNLELAKILGYTVIVRKRDFRVGSCVVFIQPDTQLPDKPWAEFFKKRSTRVKAMKLRGEWSFGIAMSPLEVFDTSSGTAQIKYWLMPENIGKDCSSVIGVTKWEAPMPQDMDAKGLLPHFLSKTDEERYQNFDSLPYGEEVDITLKIDGKSATFYCTVKVVDVPDIGPIASTDQVGICTRSMDLKLDSTNHFTAMEKRYDILARLAQYCVKHQVSLALRGEIYGKGIQSTKHNPHSKSSVDFAAFSVFNIDKRRYENRGSQHYYVNVCAELNIPTVPFVQYSQPLTPELIKYFAEETSTLFYNIGSDDTTGQKPFEGVVIKHSRGSFKVMNLNYDEQK